MSLMKKLLFLLCLLSWSALNAQKTINRPPFIAKATETIEIAAVHLSDTYAPDGTERRKSHANAPANGWAESAGRPGYAAHSGEESPAASADRGEHGKGAGDLY